MCLNGESSPKESAALAAEVLRRSGRLRLRVFGASMLPTLWPGDEVDLAGCSLRDAAPGEIIVAWRDGRFFLHRYLASHEDGFLARGDAMPRPDPPYAADACLGKVIAVKRAGQTAWVFLPATPPNRALGLLLCYSRSARRLALKFHDHRGAQNELGDAAA